MYKSPSELSGPEEQLLQARTVLCFGELTAALAQAVSEQLLLLAARSRAPIKLIINAQGGPLSLGEALYDVIAGSAVPVRAIGAGAVSGAAALAFVAPPRAQRFCLPHARFSLHQALGSQASLAGLDVLAAADELARHRRRLHELLARQTGQPLDVIARDTERATWLSAEEAVAYGLVGRVVQGVGEV
jgi:ATP-dependent Clp protease, protease subunit